MSLRSVLDDVVEERLRQEKKWGQQNHNPFEYLAILGEEVGEVNRAALENYDYRDRMWVAKDNPRWGPYRKELVQVAAVAVAMIECLDRGNWK